MLLVVVDLFASSILHLSIWKGHNNDKYAFDNSQIQLDHDQFLLADAGFSGPGLILPHDPEFNNLFPSFHSTLRVIIENLFGNQAFGSWKFMRAKISDSIPYHAIALHACCEIINLQLNNRPMRIENLTNIQSRNLLANM